jgi:putative ABC transport system permease protein
MILADVLLAAQNLRAQKTRTFLTTLGIVFGVGSVIGMLAIGAGAREESLSFIEQLGVRNVLVDSRPAANDEERQQRRRSSPGLTERDVRVLEANIESLELISPRRTLRPSRVLPKPAREMPDLYGVRPVYAVIQNLRTVEGRFFDEKHDAASAAVCVLGQGAKVDILGYGPAAGKFVKVNDAWLEVIGVLGESLRAGGQTQGGRMIDLNMTAWLKDDLDGIDLRLKPGADSLEMAKIVTAILNSTHNNTQDFTVTIPAALLAQQQRTQTIFTYAVLERTREIGVRRAIGAKRKDIVKQFLTESVLISMSGGALGVAFGFFLAWLITSTAEWKTIVTTASVAIALGVSVAVGVVFGIYPAVKASRINPIEALRYE